jgi:hypothetical protein
MIMELKMSLRTNKYTRENTNCCPRLETSKTGKQVEKKEKPKEKLKLSQGKTTNVCFH